MDKKEALAAAMKQIEKEFGKGSIMRLGDDSARMDVKAVSTGILPLDLALGIGGLRNLRPRSGRQDDSHVAHDSIGSKSRRDGGIYRR